MTRLQQILRMRHDCGWPIRRIGEVSGVSVGTVHAVLEEEARAWPHASNSSGSRM